MALDITVYSDYICPYCYVGMGTLDELAKKHDLKVTWRGLEIHPETPDEGTPLREFFAGHDIESSLQALKERAEALGLPFTDLQLLANSQYALQAGEFARAHDLHTPYHRAMMHAYFAEGKNIGKLEVVLAVGKQVGLDTKLLEEALVTGHFEEELAAEMNQARQWGISGTPTFIINGQYKIVGAHPLETFEQFFEEITA